MAHCDAIGPAVVSVLFPGFKASQCGLLDATWSQHGPAAVTAGHAASLVRLHSSCNPACTQHGQTWLALHVAQQLGSQQTPNRLCRSCKLAGSTVLESSCWEAAHPSRGLVGAKELCRAVTTA
eukprot:363053-Chlamydomonas_euryale.AAC.8